MVEFNTFLFFYEYRFAILVIYCILVMVSISFYKSKSKKKIFTIDKPIDNRNQTILSKNTHYSVLSKEARSQRFNENRKIRYKKHLKSLIKKGNNYEKYVAEHYKSNGYEVILNGIIQGKKDNGIDIICNKNNELILIQCKNWNENCKYRINHEKLKAFIGSCTEYVNEHKLFDKNIKLKFISSNYILDESGKRFLEKSNTLDYKVLPYYKEVFK